MASPHNAFDVSTSSPTNHRHNHHNVPPAVPNQQATSGTSLSSPPFIGTVANRHQQNRRRHDVNHDNNKPPKGESSVGGEEAGAFCNNDSHGEEDQQWQRGGGMDGKCVGREMGTAEYEYTNENANYDSSERRFENVREMANVTTNSRQGAHRKKEEEAVTTNPSQSDELKRKGRGGEKYDYDNNADEEEGGGNNQDYYLEDDAEEASHWHQHRQHTTSSSVKSSASSYLGNQIKIMPKNSLPGASPAVAAAAALAYKSVKNNNINGAASQKANKNGGGCFSDEDDGGDFSDGEGNLFSSTIPSEKMVENSKNCSFEVHRLNCWRGTSILMPAMIEDTSDWALITTISAAASTATTATTRADNQQQTERTKANEEGQPRTGKVGDSSQNNINGQKALMLVPLTPPVLGTSWNRCGNHQNRMGSESKKATKSRSPFNDDSAFASGGGGGGATANDENDNRKANCQRTSAAAATATMAAHSNSTNMPNVPRLVDTDVAVEANSFLVRKVKEEVARIHNNVTLNTDNNGGGSITDSLLLRQLSLLDSGDDDEDDDNEEGDKRRRRRTSSSASRPATASSRRNSVSSAAAMGAQHRDPSQQQQQQSSHRQHVDENEMVEIDMSKKRDHKKSDDDDLKPQKFGTSSSTSASSKSASLFSRIKSSINKMKAGMESGPASNRFYFYFPELSRGIAGTAVVEDAKNELIEHQKAYNGFAAGIVSGNGGGGGDKQDSETASSNFYCPTSASAYHHQPSLQLSTRTGGLLNNHLFVVAPDIWLGEFACSTVHDKSVAVEGHVILTNKHLCFVSDVSGSGGGSAKFNLRSVTRLDQIIAVEECYDTIVAGVAKTPRTTTTSTRVATTVVAAEILTPPREPLRDTSSNRNAASDTVSARVPIFFTPVLGRRGPDVKGPKALQIYLKNGSMLQLFDFKSNVLFDKTPTQNYLSPATVAPSNVTIARRRASRVGHSSAAVDACLPSPPPHSIPTATTIIDDSNTTVPPTTTASFGGGSISIASLASFSSADVLAFLCPQLMLPSTMKRAKPLGNVSATDPSFTLQAFFYGQTRCLPSLKTILRFNNDNTREAGNKKNGGVNQQQHAQTSVGHGGKNATATITVVVGNEQRENVFSPASPTIVGDTTASLLRQSVGGQGGNGGGGGTGREEGNVHGGSGGGGSVWREGVNLKRVMTKTTTSIPSSANLLLLLPQRHNGLPVVVSPFGISLIKGDGGGSDGVDDGEDCFGASEGYEAGGFLTLVDVEHQTFHRKANDCDRFESLLDFYWMTARNKSQRN